MVKIFSGDDTDFKGDQRLALTFAAPDVDFTGCTAEIEFLGQRRTFAQVTNGGRLAFSFSADETRGMRCGVWPVTIRLRDASGRVRTVDNTQRIKVTNDVNEAYADTEQELSVALRSGGVALPDIPATLDADSSDSVGQFKAKYNSLLELLRSVSMVAVAVLLPFAADAASVTTAPLDDIPGTALVVTNVDLSGLAPQGITTDDVCAIVTNVVGGGWSAWTVYRDGVDVTDRIAQPWYNPPPDDYDPEVYDWWAWRTPVVAEDQEFSTADGEHGDENTDSLSWSGVDNQHVDHEYTATRRMLPVRNALGLARLEDLPSTNGFVRADDVSSIVTNETDDVFTAWQLHGEENYELITPVASSIRWDGVRWVMDVAEDGYVGYCAAPKNATELTFYDVVCDAGAFQDTVHATRSLVAAGHNALGLARQRDVSAVSNVAASASSKADTLSSYLAGYDARVVITNYDSATVMPSISFQQKLADGGSNFWRVVWNEMTRWDWFLPMIGHQTNMLWAAIEEKADRAWGYYDSHTGNWAPDGYTWLSSPRIAIAAGLSYQRTVTSGGAVWVLESNGLVADIGGVSSNGYFRISDDDGNAMFEIVKGNKRTVGSTAGGITTENVMGIMHCRITYNVESPEHPTIYATTDLGSVPFVSEESSGSLVNVTWTGSSGAWVAEVWPKSASSSLFVKAEHDTGGETYIRNAVPVSAAGGILCTDGVHKVRPVYNNGSVTWEVMP